MEISNHAMSAEAWAAADQWCKIRDILLEELRAAI